MIDFVGPLNTGVAAGGAGVATANATGSVAIRGQLVGFQVVYNDSPPATSDVTIEAVSGPLGTRTLLTISSANTSGFFAVRQGAVSVANAAITDSNVPLVLIDDKLKVTLAQADNGDSVDVYAVVER